MAERFDQIPRKSYSMAGLTGMAERMIRSGVDRSSARAFETELTRIMAKQAIDERLNYGWIEDNIGGGGQSTFTAIVDNRLSANDPDNNEFRSIHEAVNHYGSAAGGSLTSVRLFVRFSGTTYAETAAFTMGSIVRLYIEGERYFMEWVDGTNQGNLPKWTTGTATSITASTGKRITLRHLHIEPVFGTTNNLFSAASAHVTAEHCRIGPDRARGSGAPHWGSLGGLWARDCVLYNPVVTWIYWRDCTVGWATNDGSTPTIALGANGHNDIIDCNLEAVSSNGTIFALESGGFTKWNISGCRFVGGKIGNDTAVTFQFNYGGDRLVITGTADSGMSVAVVLSKYPNQHFIYDIAGNINGRIEMNAAPASELTASAVIIRGSVGDEIGRSTKIVGPAMVDLMVDHINNFSLTPLILQGSRINGQVAMTGGGNNSDPGPTDALVMQGLTDSLVTFVYKSLNASDGVSVAPGTRAFRLDGNCTRNVVVMGGETRFAHDFVDNGTNNLVITEAGVFTSGGGGFLSKTQDDSITDGVDYSLGITTGTKLGTGPLQKLGLWGASPIGQRSAEYDLKRALVELGLIAALGSATPLNLEGGDLTADQVFAKVRRSIGHWFQDNVAAAQTDVALNLYGDTTRQRLPVMRSGQVSGIVVRSNAARTAGTLTVEVTINGVGTGIKAILDATNTTAKATTVL